MYVRCLEKTKKKKKFQLGDRMSLRIGLINSILLNQRPNDRRRIFIDLISSAQFRPGDSTGGIMTTSVSYNRAREE